MFCPVLDGVELVSYYYPVHLCRHLKVEKATKVKLIILLSKIEINVSQAEHLYRLKFIGMSQHMKKIKHFMGRWYLSFSLNGHKMKTHTST